MGKGGGNGGRYRHERAVLEDHGGARGCRSLHCGRGSRRYGMARRLQLPVGVVERMVCWPGGLAGVSFPIVPLRKCISGMSVRVAKLHECEEKRAISWLRATIVGGMRCAP